MSIIRDGRQNYFDLKISLADEIRNVFLPRNIITPNLHTSEPMLEICKQIWHFAKQARECEVLFGTSGEKYRNMRIILWTSSSANAPSCIE